LAAPWTAASGKPTARAAYITFVIRCPQKAQYGICLVQSRLYLVASLSILGLIIRQDNDGAPGFPSPCPANVLRRVQQGVGYARSAIESLSLQDIMQLTYDLAVIPIKWQPYFGTGVEYHNCHPILRGQNPQSLLGGICDALDVRLHAPAYIEQQQYVDWHVLTGEIPNRLDFSVHPQHEVIRF